METTQGLKPPIDPHVLTLREAANNVAAYIMESSMLPVAGVELFGSVGRGNGRSESDLDMIVLADGLVAGYWVRDFKYRVSSSGHPIRTCRFNSAVRILGLNVDGLSERSGDVAGRIDLFIYPPNWREVMPTLASLWHRWDMRFLRDIAPEAIAYIPGSGFAFPEVPIPDPVIQRDPSSDH